MWIRVVAEVTDIFAFWPQLSQIRFMAGYGAEFQHEPVSLSHAMLAATKRLKLIAALLPVSPAKNRRKAKYEIR